MNHVIGSKFFLEIVIWASGNCVRLLWNVLNLHTRSASLLPCCSIVTMSLPYRYHDINSVATVGTCTLPASLRKHSIRHLRLSHKVLSLDMFMNVMLADIEVSSFKFNASHMSTRCEFAPFRD